jgi:phospholipid/cholesterol/gamma-HCH transport system substrate-binding protein
MEIRARYVLIGAFTLAVMMAGFGFVYWLNNAGAMLQRAVYRIQYEKTVSGLLKGSAVLFNGIRVGEVTALDLDARQPRRIMVSIAIDRTTPVRADTRAAIEFQGLTGAPAVALFGGEAAAPLLAAAGQEPPLLVADPNTGQNVTEVARETLRHIDGLVVDNAEALRTAITGISSFSSALGRNSDRVDGIVAGIERMTGGGQKAPLRIYELAAVRQFKGLGPPPAGQLLIPEVSGLGTFDTDKVLLRGEGQKPFMDGAQWPDVLPKLLQARIIQSFENAGYLRIFGRAPEGVTAEHQLLVDVRSFQAAMVPAATAEVEFAAKVIRNDGKVLDVRIFRASVPAKGSDAGAITAALDEGFGRVVGELVPWALATMK